ncbi:MAG: MFS transporter [Anaerolineae bacterium]|nr:MFS transporter [Anaerolineae bacterium]
MITALTQAEKIRHLHWNTALNGFGTVFYHLVYFGSAFVLFLNELEFSSSEIGFLLSLLLFSNVVALFVAPTIARIGFKRSFVTFFGLGRISTLGLLAVPWVLETYGVRAAFTAVAVTVLAYSICKAIGETAIFPWSQEFIPNAIRGRYSAVSDVVTRLVGIASIAFAGVVLGLSTDIHRFIILFAVGIIAGGIAVWASTHIVGGAPIPKPEETARGLGRFSLVLKDRNFVVYLAAFCVVTLGSLPMYSFLPLYMTQQIGLSDSVTVSLQIGTLLGGLTTTYLLGWAADRYGSKPVLALGLILKALLPIAWMLMPRETDWSLPIALGIAVIAGIGEIAWVNGALRLLFVGVVPAQYKSQYMAVYTATTGIVGGVGWLIGGRLLDASAGISGQIAFITLDPFSPLFIIGLALTVVGIVLFRRVRADSTMSLGEFAGMFVHGNPILAMGSVARYYRARDERELIAVTERMSQTKSPLTEAELLAALKDPRFNVRFEAVISIARMSPSPQLIDALCGILDGTELSLTVIAAWALGRLGDPSAIPALRRGLHSEYRSIQAHCARALGTLGDNESIPLLRERLNVATDKGLRMACAAALGNLGASEALGDLLAMLDTTENEGARMELALAVARIAGHERHFIHLLRSLREDRGTGAYQAMVALKKRLKAQVDRDLLTLIEQADAAFAKEQFDQGIASLSQMIRALPPDVHTPTGRIILDECAARLDDYADSRPEYLLLALHTLYVTAV